jgi:hypothetical protein
MVFTLITDCDEIQTCQTRLEDELKKRGQHFTSDFSVKGQEFGPRAAYYLKDFGIFYRPGSRETQHRNCFGQGKPTKRFKDAFQLNVPKSGVNRSTKGGFLKAGSAICVLHRGPLGGGRKDGSHNLCDYFNDLVDTFDDDGRDTEGVVIRFLDKSGQLEPSFLPTIKRIVDGVAQRLGRTE